VPSPGEFVRSFPDPEAPPLRQPHAILAFGGWVDAGSAGTGAVRHLIASLSPRKLADIDPEEFYNFTDTRPLSSIVAPGHRAVHWPRGEFFGANLPEAETDSDLLLFVAPEPNLKWRTFANALLDVLQEAGARSLLSLGSIFGAVHHRADVPLTGWATDGGLREALVKHKVSFTNYEGPTGFVTILLAEAQARGLPAAALFGFAPNYIQGVPNPRVSHALLRVAASIDQLPLQLGDLDRAGRALLRQVDKLLADQPELREQVERMLNMMNLAEPSGTAEPEPEPPPSPDLPPSGATGADLPSGQAVVRELEEFLKQLRENESGPSEPSGG
jgi:proteasome assembly chaperone (PAC2) family protein